MAAVAARLLIAANVSVQWAGDRVDRLLGLALLVLATVLGRRLVWEICGEAYGRRRRWALFWQLAVLGALASLAAEECRWLAVADDQLADWVRWSRPALRIAEVRLRLLPTCLATLMVGLCCAMQSTRLGGSRSLPRAWSILAGVVAASVVALLLATVETGLIGYLVLLALQGVRNAFIGIPALDATLFRRLDRVAGLALAAAVSTLWLALCIALDARRPTALGLHSIALRVDSVATTISLAATLVAVSFSTVDPYLAQGLHDRIGPTEFAIVALAFLGLAARLAARVVDQSPGNARVSCGARAAGLAGGALLSLGLLGTVGRYLADLPTLRVWLQGPIQGVFGLQSTIRAPLLAFTFTNAI